MIDAEILQALLSYNAETGLLVWKTRPADMFASEGHMRRWNSNHAGKPALNAEHSAGYRHGSLLGKHVLAHRVAWAIAHGRWPTDQIDHINGDRSDNRLSNLREVDALTNRRNSSRHPHNKTGVNGVHRRRDGGRYLANILVGGRTVYLGLFDTVAEAAAARQGAERALGYHRDHGKRHPAYYHTGSDGEGGSGAKNSRPEAA